MCRYTMYAYKEHYACFDCLKTFKRRLIRDIDRNKINSCDNPEEKISKCPQCAKPMANMGKDFEAPKMKDKTAWKHLQKLYKVGITFHSCGCYGPGCVPADDFELTTHLENIKKTYIDHLRFWINRDPSKKKRTQKEIQADNNENCYYLFKIPKELKEGTRKNPKTNIEKAIVYWTDNIAKIDKHLKSLEYNI